MFRATITTLADIERMLAAMPRHFSANELPEELLEALQSQSITVNGMMPEDNAGGALPEVPGLPPPPLPPLAPVRREVPKVGPNDPCPCGSGKKYKKCCGK